MADASLQLGKAVDRARLDMGLSKLDLARVAKVGRSTIAELINRGKLPMRPGTRQRIEAALGWAEGSFEAVLDGGEPSLRSGTEFPPNATTAVLVEQLSQISSEAHASARIADALSRRLQLIGELAESAAQLATRTR